MHIAVVVLVFLITIVLFRLFWKKTPQKSHEHMENTGGLQPIPIVPGALPFVGHGLEFSRDLISFISSCVARYGPVFQIQIFRLNVVVVCDRVLAPEMLKTSEDNLSLYDAMRDLYIGHGFSKAPEQFLHRFSAVVRKSVGGRLNDFVPIIKNEAEQMAARLMKRCTDAEGGCFEIDLTEEMMLFISNTSANCFVGLGLTHEVFKVLLQFTYLLNYIILLNPIFPAWFVKICADWKMRSFRSKIGAYFESEIETYRQDPEKTGSLVLRRAADYRTVEGEGEEVGRVLTNEEIQEILICLMYASTENSAKGLTNSLIDLMLHQDLWEELRGVCSSYLDTGNIQGLLDDQLLNACVMETARMNTHIFPVIRKPTRDMTFGKKYFLDANRAKTISKIALCAPMLQVHGPTAAHVFKNPTEYNPKRFLRDMGNESFKSLNIMTWGGGLHNCPGKMFALYEIKIALALILTQFDMEILGIDNGPPENNYNSPTSFSERKVKVCVRAR